MFTSLALLVSLIFACASLAWTAPSTPTTTSPPVHLVYQSRPKDFEWLGSLAIRPNGSILTADLFGPRLFQINPLASDPKAQLIYRFPNATGLTAITETCPDTYEVIAGNFTEHSNAAKPGSLRVYRVDYSASTEPKVSLTADLSHVPLLNGLTPLNPTLFLGTDSVSGKIWSVDTQTGQAIPVITDPLMSPQDPIGPHNSPLGVNGIKIRKEDCTTFLYFTNTAKGILAKIEINPEDGTPANGTQRAVVIANTPGAKLGIGYDDFTFGPAVDGIESETAFLCDSRGNTISRLEPNGHQEIIAGNLNSTEVAEPSDAAFGRTERDRHVLYVSTAGGLGNKINGSVVVGGQIVAIDTRGLSW